MIGFGRSRVPSYFGRAPRTPQSAVNPPPAVPYGGMEGEEDPKSRAGGRGNLITPATPAATAPPSGGGSNGQPIYLAPPAAPTMTRDQRFQQSLDNERATTARSAQVFAQGSPVPTDSAGNYNGSYASPQQAQAAKDAYVDRAATRSNLASGNYYVNRQLASEANERENASNAANAGYVNALAGGVEANTNLMLPAQADAITAQGEATRGANTRANQMAPYEADAMQAQTQGQGIKNQALAAGIPFIAPQMKNEVAQGQANLDRFNQMTPGVVAGTYDAARDTAATIKQQRQLLQDEEGFVKQKAEGQSAATPVDPVKATADREKAANEIGERNYGAQNLWQRATPSWFPFTGNSKSKAEMVDAARNSLPAIPATPAAPSHPVGTIISNPSTGQRLKWDGSKWVPA